MMLDLGKPKIRKIEEKENGFYCTLFCGGKFPLQRV